MRYLWLLLMVGIVNAITFKVWWLQGNQPFVAYQPWKDQKTLVCANATVEATISALLKGIGSVKLAHVKVYGCKEVTLKSFGPLAPLVYAIKMDVKAGNVYIKNFEYMRASTGDFCIQYKLLSLPPLVPGEPVGMIVKNVCPFPVKVMGYIDPMGLELFDFVLKPNATYAVAFKMPRIYDSMLRDVYILVEGNGIKRIVFSVPAFNFVLNYLIPYSEVVWYTPAGPSVQPKGWSKACIVLPNYKPYLNLPPTKATYEVYQQIFGVGSKLVAKTEFVAKSLNDFQRCLSFYAQTGFPIEGYYVVAKVGNVKWIVNR